MTQTTDGTPISFEIIGSDETLVLDDVEVVVAGYTGRDEAAVKEHIDELAAIGIPPPDSVPAYFPMDRAVLTQGRSITVAGQNTSGEVEPVLIRHGDRFYLTVGSDHTDRDVERDDIARSKAVCPKPVSRQAVALGTDTDEGFWDRVTMQSSVDGKAYQAGTLQQLRPALEVLQRYDEFTGRRPDVLMFGGTLPLIDGQFVPGINWTLTLRLPDGTDLRHQYTVAVTEPA